ncbi:unnamed protein product [Sympodiomycopsis kandeliae]
MHPDNAYDSPLLDIEDSFDIDEEPNNASMIQKLEKIGNDIYQWAKRHKKTVHVAALATTLLVIGATAYRQENKYLWYVVITTFLIAIFAVVLNKGQ